MTVIVPSRPARPIRVDGGGRIPPGGTSGQALVKSSNNDYATEWGTAAAAAAWGSITGTLASQTDLAAALSAKQDTLVSGANIKTLNGSTILGSGDLVISASAAWGGITGTLSDQTDLNTALGLKANTSSLAAVATSGSASDLGTGTLPIARIADGAVTLAKQADMATASLVYRKTSGSGAPEVQTLATLKTDLGLTGTNTGDQTITLTGMVTGSGTGSFAASLGSFTKAQLDAAVSDGNVLYVGDVTTNATHTGEVTGSGALTIAADAVTNAKLANVATATIKGRATAGTGDPEDLTGTQATALLDTFTSGAKGLVPASGGGTTNFLRADGTFAAPGGGGSPGGSSGEIQYNNGGAFAGAADVEIEGGQLRLPAIATPSAPAASGMKLFSKNFALTPMPFVLSPSDVIPWPVQPMIGEGAYRLFLPATGTTVTSLGWPAITGQGTATAATVGTGNRRTNMQRIEYLVTTPSTTAVAGARMNSNGMAVNGSSSWEGGFCGFMYGGPSTGMSNSSHRFFMGMGDTGASSDVQPSSLTSIVGVGWDAADANMQFMHNDGSGTATKVDLGSSFAKPTSDRAVIYRLRLFAPPGTTRTLSYEVTELESGAVASGTVTTDLPDATSYVTPKMYASVGGVSAVIGVAVGSWAFQTEPLA